MSRDRTVTFTVPGKPRGLPRPRATARGGYVRFYGSASAKKLLARIRAAYLAAAGKHVPHQGAVELWVSAFFAAPTRLRKADRGRLADEAASHVGKPDLDNIIKAVCDALNELAWEDDSQVAYITASKNYGASPQLWVRVLFADADPAGGVRERRGEREGGGGE